MTTHKPSHKLPRCTTHFVFVWVFFVEVEVEGEAGCCSGDGKYNYRESDGRFGRQLHKTRVCWKESLEYCCSKLLALVETTAGGALVDETISRRPWRPVELGANTGHPKSTCGERQPRRGKQSTNQVRRPLPRNELIFLLLPCSFSFNRVIWRSCVNINVAEAEMIKEDVVCI